MKFPLRNLESGDAKRSQAWSHIFRDCAEIFADHPRLSALCQHHLQIFFSFPLVRCAILRGLIIARREMRRCARRFSPAFAPGSVGEIPRSCSAATEMRRSDKIRARGRCGKCGRFVSRRAPAVATRRNPARASPASCKPGSPSSVPT